MSLDILHATEEIMAHVQDEIDNWLASNDLTLEFDTSHLEALVEEALVGLLEK
ncbi:hypothetical protein LCGC14_0869550 [marine sediment metagenome]|uniref:Uncharacterized protein n=1 Tax=marine sediment metagenome TaxID=412755 RepID=A0A0F9P9Y3_9ZZZZ